MNHSMDLFILWTALAVGLRHSLDFDHLAAITDIAGSQSTRKASFWGSLGYALGHAGIVLLLGGLALALGFQVPAAWGAVMEKVVGATLLLLAGAIIISALKYRDEGKILSRWRILSNLARQFRLTWWRSKNADDKNLDDLSFTDCLAIGVLHGIGVESPTQIFALGSAMTIGNALVGFEVLSAFALGMIVSSMAVALLAIYGFQSAKRRKMIFIVLSLLSALFSAGIGCMLIFG